MCYNVFRFQRVEALYGYTTAHMLFLPNKPTVAVYLCENDRDPLPYVFLMQTFYVTMLL